MGSVGISLAGSDKIIISDCISHHNKGDGLYIGVNAPIATLPKPATNVQVAGGFYHCNGNSGIAVVSGFDNASPTNIQLLNNSVLRNDGRGINIEAGWNVLISNPTAVDNGNAGIWLENLPKDQSNTRTIRVQITNPFVYNNGRLVNVNLAGIGLRAVNQVNINGGKIFKTHPTSHQNYGIGLYVCNADTSCVNLRILDVDASTGEIKPVEPLDLVMHLHKHISFMNLFMGYASQDDRFMGVVILMAMPCLFYGTAIAVVTGTCVHCLGGDSLDN